VSTTFQIFLATSVDMHAILHEFGWTRAPMSGPERGFELQGRDWVAFAFDPSPMSWEDAPPAAVALRAGIAWHVEVAVEGSDKGLSKVMRAIRAIAKAGSGVIADEDNVWVPGSSRRSRWSAPISPLTSETEWLTIAWWTIDPATRTKDGAAAFADTLWRLLPEAMPVRWGEFEPFQFSLETDGQSGLARFMYSHRDDFLATKVRPPFAELNVHGPGPRSYPHPQPHAMRIISIEAGGSVLRHAGWGRQLAIAFSALSLVVHPFYAEARLDPRVIWHHGQRRMADVPPTSTYYWYGFPRTPPMAMVVGPPYTSYWYDGGGTSITDMMLYSSDSWPDPPSGGVPVAPDDLLQEFDPRWADGGGLRAEYPRKPPPVWPFT
jgi:hypothetical protein